MGARIYYVLFFELTHVYRGPHSHVLLIWDRGLAIYGGLSYRLIALYWYSRKENVPVWAPAQTSWHHMS
ncbi:MAG: prolipoprotein diacylglyceryl transferase family protein [Alkalibacterium sp.]|nr:prolipoprotein diacylglyceryl transferase family protein [Alkalibacterium sp.]